MTRIKLSLVQRRDLGVDDRDYVYFTEPGTSVRTRAQIRRSPFAPRTADFERCNNEGLAVVVGGYYPLGRSVNVGGQSCFRLTDLQISTSFEAPAPVETAPTAPVETTPAVSEDTIRLALRGEDDGDSDWYVAPTRRNPNPIRGE